MVWYQKILKNSLAVTRYFKVFLFRFEFGLSLAEVVFEVFLDYSLTVCITFG